jgi:hypothetical protein
MNAKEEAMNDEYRRRVEMFREFAEALRKWAATERSVLVFEDGNDPNDREVVTFRYRGNRLRIKHSYKPENHPCTLASAKPNYVARAVPSKLELLEAREPPDKDVPLASIEDINADWEVTLPVSEAENPHAIKGLIRTVRIAEKPQWAFEELERRWQEQTKTNAPL